MIYIQTQQSVFPKAIYIGDRAELRCSFSSGGALSTGTLSSEAFSESLDFSLYDINSITLQKTGVDYYTLVINFVPWKTGTILLPDFEIETAGVIHFEEVQVLSLVNQKGITDLRSYNSPLLLPGTTYKIYGGIAFGLILLIVVIRLVIKWHSVVLWVKNLKLRRKFAHSRRYTVKALKALVAENLIEQDFPQKCTKLQKIMREYLEVRLAYPFTKTLTSELSLAFDKATFGLADENRLSAFEDIIAVFIRTDYVRFSDSASAEFNDSEFSTLVNNLIDDIGVIEEVSDKKGDRGGNDA